MNVEMRNKIRHVEKTKKQYDDVCVQSDLNRLYELAARIDFMEDVRLEHDSAKLGQIQSFKVEFHTLYNETMNKFKEQDEESYDFVSADKVVA